MWEKQRNKGIKRACPINRFLVGMLVWPRLASGQCSLPSRLTKFHPHSFSGEGLCSACMCVYGALSAPVRWNSAET